MASFRLNLRRYQCTGVVALLLLFPVTSSFAQGDGTIVGKTWQYFIERCTFAYSDTQGYLDDLAAGRGSIGASEDRSIVWAGTTGTQLHDTFKQVAVGDRTRQECYVLGHFDGDSTSPERLNDDFAQILSEVEGVTITGGASSKELDKFYPAIPYRYVVLGALPNDIVALITFGQSSVEIQSYYERSRE